jgi:hypothetical protein
MGRACLIYFPLILIGISACVERYYPEEDDLRTGTLVIHAHLTDQPGEQVIEISRSTGLTEPLFDPVSGSLAEVIREDGEFRIFSEYKPGYYSASLNEAFLVTGESYMLHVITPDGEEYQSDFDRLRPVPGIDSLYYQVEHNSYASETDTISGIRFYLDFTYDNEAYEYIRWDLTETYEFHNPNMEAFILDVDFILKELPDTSNYRVCYITNEIPTIYSMSLRPLDFGAYIRKPFAFIPNIQLEQKLHYKYSLLVKQYSLGPEAFHYWDELKKTFQEQGSLFDRQPALLESNIHNVNDDSEVVLGFFSMAGVVEKRAFAIKPEGLDLSMYEWFCFPIPIPGARRPNRNDLPLYYARAWKDGASSFAEVRKSCVDCREYKNSTHIKPGFW